MTPDRERDEASQISTDPDTIRTWADAHDAKPHRHREEDRFHLKNEDEADDAHERVEWDEFSTHIEGGDDVVIYHGEGTESPFEVAERDEAISRSNVSREELEDRLIEGETVTSTVTETTVVEEVIVEEATVESELIDTEIVDDRVVDVELLSRECSNCSLEDTGLVEERDWFDDERYRESIAQPGIVGQEGVPRGETTSSEATVEETETSTMSDTDMGMRDVEEEYPYDVHLDVEEEWSLTREFTERFTVESRITNVDVDETDTIEDRDIDVEGLQRNIAESDLFDIDLTSAELLRECDVETEFHEDDRIETHFSRSRVVEDEIVDRRRVRAEVTAAELLSVERVETEMPAESTTDATIDDTDVATEEETAVAGEGEVPLSPDEVGKDVVDATGEKIGMVTDVSEDGRTMYVDAHPSITERIKAALDWGGADDDDYPVDIGQIDHIERDEIKLKRAEELDEATPSA